MWTILSLPRLFCLSKMYFRPILFLLVLLFSNAIFAQVQYRAGLIAYTPAYDFVTGFSPNGTGFYVAQAYIPSPPQPQVNQVYYVAVVMTGIVSPAVGRLVGVHLIPPAGTSIVANASTPVRCFYRAMDGNGNYVEFTNSVVNDVSFGANLRVTGCPQPSAGPNPYSIVNIPNGTAYLFDRRDPNNNSVTWPLGSYASYEFQIPVVSNRTMDGFSNNNLFYAPVWSIQGDGLDPWGFPALALLVNPVSAEPVADMVVTQQLPPPPPPPNKTSYSIRCTNNGPNTATNANCGFVNIPVGRNAIVNCQPVVPVALVSGASIGCSVVMDRFIGTASMSGVSSSQSIDNNLTNNNFAFILNGGLSDYIFGGGIAGSFEICPVGQAC